MEFIKVIAPIIFAWEALFLIYPSNVARFLPPFARAEQSFFWANHLALRVTRQAKIGAKGQH